MATAGMAKLEASFYITETENTYSQTLGFALQIEGKIVEKQYPQGKGGDPGWIRTSDHRLRRQVLYPTELRSHAGSLG